MSAAAAAAGSAAGLSTTPIPYEAIKGRKDPTIRWRLFVMNSAVKFINQYSVEETGEVVDFDDDLHLTAVKLDRIAKSVWVPNNCLRRSKRKLPSHFEPSDLDFEYKQGDVIEYCDSDTGELEQLTFQEQRGDCVMLTTAVNPCTNMMIEKYFAASSRIRMRLLKRHKRTKDDARSESKCPTLNLIWQYLGNESTWVERHVASRWYMIHSKEPTLQFAEENDGRLAEEIRRHFSRELNLGPCFWDWVSKHAILTGAALLAFAHGNKKFFECKPRAREALEVFRSPAKTTPFNWSCQQYQFAVLQSREYVVYDLMRDMMIETFGADIIDGAYGDTIYSANRVHYVERIWQRNDSPVEAANCLMTTPSHMGIHFLCIRRDVDWATTFSDEKSGREFNTLHDHINPQLHYLSVLCMSYDGVKFRVGADTLEDRDRVATLVSEYRPLHQIPDITSAQPMDVIGEYMRLGVTITNCRQMYESIGELIFDGITKE